MTGQAINAAPMEQRVEKPRVNFDNGRPEFVLSDEEREYAHIARMSQKTKFATGNLEVDIKNYLTIKKMAEMITGLINDES